MESKYEIIDKEKIQLLSFPNVEVLSSDEEIKQRFVDLNRALYLGNLEHSKIKIYFEDNQSKKVVETTVWALTDHRVILKQGFTIPIHRIFMAA